jgi:hypothetical protein
VTALARAMNINLRDHQLEAVDKLKPGSILCGGVGSGKSRTALAYYFVKIGNGQIKINDVGKYLPMKTPKDLYIITTAKKRDSLEWEGECLPFLLSTNPKVSINGIKVVVDSWHNIKKYVGVENAFFIFDEQKVIGSGTWVKSFLKITKNNLWVILTATPGDTWMDYVPVFIANGYYKNRTEFIRRHVMYVSRSKFPRIDRYLETNRLIRLKNEIVVYMPYDRIATPFYETLVASYNKEDYNKVMKRKWNIFKNKPIMNVSELGYLLRRVANSDKSRVEILDGLLAKHPRIIVFYTFDYELDILKEFSKDIKIPMAEWNGHKHELIPNTKRWLYLVQYTSGAESWNCIETNCIVFYSQSYSYKMTVQAAGRIDRLNTKFKDLYYYYIRSNAIIDLGIKQALKNKKNFNEHTFLQI